MLSTKSKIDKDDISKMRLFLNKNIAQTSKSITLPCVGNLFGLELELEGKKLRNNLVIPGWISHQEGSLRGDAVEWVFEKPASYAESLAKLEQLFEALKQDKAVIKNSYRCSTHVHLNFSDKKVYQLISLFILYALIEGILTKWCGQNREGNLFCLRIKDAEDLLETLSECVFKWKNFIPFTNEMRYAGINLCSLNKFNTVELRTMRGVNSKQEVEDWLEIVNHLYEFSLNNVRSPAEIIETVSYIGIRGFLSEIFPEKIVNNFYELMNENELYTSVYENIRLVQMFAYNVSQCWSIEKELVKKVSKRDKIQIFRHYLAQEIGIER